MNAAKVLATTTLIGAVLDAAELTEAESGVIVAAIVSAGAEMQTKLSPLTYVDRVAMLAKLDLVMA
jgi:hypothetical protein